MTFKGFQSGKTHFTPIPADFFSEILPEVDHLGELKIILYVFWRLDRMEGTFRYIRHDDFLSDPLLMKGLGDVGVLDDALKRLLEHNVLLSAAIQTEGGADLLYFLNSPKGRSAVQAIQQGEFRAEGDKHPTINLTPEPPNIFRLYETNIGPLTPMIAEALGEAEDTYPGVWIEEAFRIAVENNARNWRYIVAILKRWQEEGRHDEKDRRDSEKTRRKYIEGELSDYVEH